jgi:hypothetical protein
LGGFDQGSLVGVVLGCFQIWLRRSNRTANLGFSRRRLKTLNESFSTAHLKAP